jgi:hypothetical protein
MQKYTLGIVISSPKFEEARNLRSEEIQDFSFTPDKSGLQSK